MKWRNETTKRGILIDKGTRRMEGEEVNYALGNTERLGGRNDGTICNGVRDGKKKQEVGTSRYINMILPLLVHSRETA